MPLAVGALGLVLSLRIGGGDGEQRGLAYLVPSYIQVVQRTELGQRLNLG